MTDIRDIAAQLSAQRAQKQNKLRRYRAEIVEMRNSAGQDSIHVEARSLYVWVRLWSGRGNVVPARNDRVAAVVGLPVWVEETEDDALQIVGIDWEIYDAQSDQNTGLVTPMHHEAHEWPDLGPGLDAITVYPRAWSQLKTYPADPLGTTVNVSPLRYQVGSTLVVFNGGVADLTAAIAALAANQARLVLIYLDTATNALATANGAIGTIAAGWFLGEPTIPTGAYPSAVVRIYNGQTEIVESDIRDRRFFLNPAPGTWSNVRWGRVWIVAQSGGDFTAVTTAVADASVVDGDTILIMPGTYVGWATTKNLSYASQSPYNHASFSAEVIIQGAVTLNDPAGGTSTFYGIEFNSTFTIDYDPDVYFLSCGFNAIPSIDDGVNSDAGYIVFDHCYIYSDVDATNGTGWDIEFHDTEVYGNVSTPNQTIILWSHLQASGALTANAIERHDAPHIEWAAYGLNALIVGHQWAQYATIATAIAAVGAGDTIFALIDTWACDTQTLPGGSNMGGQDRDATILQSTGNPLLTLSMGATSSYLFNITVENSGTNAANMMAVYISDIAELRDVIALGTNTNAGAAAHAYGFAILGEATSARLVDCDGTGASTAGNGYGLYIGNAAAGGVVVTIEGGRYDGNTADLFCDANCTIDLHGPILVNTTSLDDLAGTGTYTGWWYDEDGLLHTANIPLVAGDEDASERVYEVTRTVGGGKDHATIQAAVDWFKHGKTLYGACKIDVDAGTYAEQIVVEDINLAQGASLEIEGDTRVLAGITYMDGAICNRNALANGGTFNDANRCTVTTNPARDEITVSGGTVDPDFNADGWGNGDKILVFDESAGTVVERTVNSINPGGAGNHVIEITVALAAALAGDGDSIMLQPDRDIAAGAAGAAVENVGVLNLILDGFFIETSTGASCYSVYTHTCGYTLCENIGAYAEDRCFATVGGYSRLDARDGACSGWGKVTGCHNFQASGASQIRCQYSMAIFGQYGYFANQFSFMNTEYSGATGFDTANDRAFYANNFSLVYCLEGTARQCANGYYANAMSFLYAAQTNNNNNGNVVDYNPAPAIPGYAQGNGYAVIYASA